MNGDSRAAASALDTVNAAATAIASSESRATQQTAQKRRWGVRWSIYWCFGSYKHKKQIGHGVLVPETTSSVSDVPAPSNSNRASTNLIVLPFIAPLSSPVSFLQSEPPSMTQSPTGILSFNSMSASMFSPGPTSIFAIGPYAHETQLVSPPVFSTFTTEPSTAPFTPPPESVHLTTPSSPEVPFAQFLDPSLGSGETGQRFPFPYYGFQSYHLQPGQLISPSSGISGSGTSSPFPDLEFRVGDPPKLLNLDRLSNQDWGSRRGSGSLTPDAAKPKSSDGLENGSQNDQAVVNQGDQSVNSTNGHYWSSNCEEGAAHGEEDRPRHRKNRSITLGSVNEFNFDNVDGGDFPKATNGSEWWANEKVAGKDATGEAKNWAFFPMIQPGLS